VPEPAAFAAPTLPLHLWANANSFCRDAFI
jgi:hypothetical protein